MLVQPDELGSSSVEHEGVAALETEAENNLLPQEGEKKKAHKKMCLVFFFGFNCLTIDPSTASLRGSSSKDSVKQQSI